MGLAENIRKFRKSKGFSQDYIAEQLGYKSYTTVQKWESGVSEPSLQKLHELANLLGVDVDTLVNAPSPKTKGVKIPVLGRVAAGVPIEAIEDIIDYEEIPESMSRSADYFGLQIRGNSMEPKISEGDVVIVRKQDDAESGNIVIATVNGDEATCKKIKKTESGLMLISTNPDYEPFIYSWEDVERIPVRILGRVVELRAKF